MRKLIAYFIKHRESEYLNAIYRRFGYRNFYKFVDRFFNGYDGLTDSEINMLKTKKLFFKDEIYRLEKRLSEL